MWVKLLALLKKDSRNIVQILRENDVIKDLYMMP